ncbi:hypothetical protein Zm00014a_030845 [Zea mays]|uniref:Uncharacterized protein n=1 Tax=Zea mays TaxID=4577 RepID=A0A3L6EKN2_MAIZE|nr:hypothetical protein Zm00014a_030845 [Zea mays]
MGHMSLQGSLLILRLLS